MRIKSNLLVLVLLCGFILSANSQEIENKEETVVNGTENE